MAASILDFLPLCPQTICWQPLIGRDEYSKPIYGPVQTFHGRRSFKFSRVAALERGTKGQGPENISESQIWILDTPNIQYEDLLYVQGDTIQNAQGEYIVPAILSISNIPNQIGPFVVKVYLGSSNG